MLVQREQGWLRCGYGVAFEGSMYGNSSISHSGEKNTASTWRGLRPNIIGAFLSFFCASPVLGENLNWRTGRELAVLDVIENYFGSNSQFSMFGLLFSEELRVRDRKKIIDTISTQWLPLRSRPHCLNNFEPLIVRVCIF